MIYEVFRKETNFHDLVRHSSEDAQVALANAVKIVRAAFHHSRERYKDV